MQNFPCMGCCDVCTRTNVSGGSYTTWNLQCIRRLRSFHRSEAAQEAIKRGIFPPHTRALSIVPTKLDTFEIRQSNQRCQAHVKMLLSTIFLVTVTAVCSGYANPAPGVAKSAVALGAHVLSSSDTSAAPAACVGLMMCIDADYKGDCIYVCSTRGTCGT